MFKSGQIILNSS